MKVTKPQIIIHAFALTHAVVSLVCQLGGIADDLLLTLLTMLMVLILCLQYKIGEQYIPIASSEMACFISEDKSNYLIKKDGKRFVIDSTMDNLEKDLNPDDFFRICRGAIVSRNSILSSTRQMGGRLKLNLIPECPTDLYVSRGRAESFLKWLG